MKFGKYILNVLLGILCALPIVTLAASITAVHFVNFKINDDDNTNVAAEFFKSFKMNLRESIILTVLIGGIGALLGYSWVSALKDINNISKGAVIITGIFTFLFFMVESISTYLLSKFDNSIGRLFLLTVYAIGSHIDAAAKMAFSEMAIIALSVLIVVVNPGVISFTIAVVFLLIALVVYEMVSIKWFMPIYKSLLASKEKSETMAEEAAEAEVVESETVGEPAQTEEIHNNEE